MGGRDWEPTAEFIALTPFGAALSVAAEKESQRSCALRRAFIQELESQLQKLISGC
jgi:hypothetical protein